MAIDFPNSPTNGQTFTVGDTTWTYDGSKWNKNAVTIAGPTGPNPLVVQPDTPSTTNVLWLDSDATSTTPSIATSIVDAKGDLITGTGADTVARLQVGSNGDLLVADSSATNGVRWQGVEIAGKNKIINGNMMVAQRGTLFTSTGGANNDDTYVLDRWYVLSDGNDAIDVTQSTEAPTGGLNSIALDVETVNKKFGIAQIIEQTNCIGLIGETVTLSFWAKVSSTTKLDNVKTAIVAWSGTADTVTSDIISAWGAEGTNPTLIANATYENTPANLGVGTSWARYSITAPIDTASTTNIIVFIWSDVTDTTLGDFLYVTDVQLEYGSVPTRFTMHGGGIEGEVAACQRYYWRPNNGGDQFSIYATGFATSTTKFYPVIFLPVAMRRKPVSLEYSGTTAYLPAIGGIAASTIALATNCLTSTTVMLEFTATGLTANRPYHLMADGSAVQYIAINAEL